MSGPPLSTRGKVHDDSDKGIHFSFIPSSKRPMVAKEFNKQAKSSIASRASKSDFVSIKESIRKRINVMSRSLTRLELNRIDVEESDDESSILSTINMGNPGELEARTAIYIQNMKGALVKRATDLRLKGTAKNPRMLSKVTLIEQIVSKLLRKEFKAEGGHKKELETSVPYELFCK